MIARSSLPNLVWLGGLAMASAMLWSSCSTGPTKLSAAGPWPPGGNTGSGTGYLVVYSGTEARHVGKEAVYYLHTPYTIRKPDGQPFKRVRNHLDDMDQSAERVTLPAGRYEVAAYSENYGNVEVPVVIEPSKTTMLHLDRRWKPEHHAYKDADLVFMPNGDAVGWRANVADAAK